MNKLLILTSFLFIFSMKINAYEYTIIDTHTHTSNLLKEVILQENEGLVYKRIYGNNTVTYNTYEFFSNMYKIKHNEINSNYLYTNTTFNELLISDLKFLSDFYTTSDYTRNVLLNYFYNESYFSGSSYVNYEDYTILYNSDGLAVESIVNGVWRGLYGVADNSGYLYYKNGDLAYINGVEPSFFEKISNKFLKPFKFHFESIFIRKIWYSLLVFIFVIVVLRTVIRMAFKAFLIRFYDKKASQAERQRDKIANA